MRRFKVAAPIVLLGMLSVAVVPAHAQTGEAEALKKEVAALRAELDRLRQTYGERLAALEAQLAAVAAAQPPPTAQAPPAAQPAEPAPAAPTATVPAGAAGAGGPSGSLPLYGGAATTSKIFNPDVAVIGNFLGVGGTNAIDPSPSLEMRESELSLQAVVDPYARGDFFLSFGEEGVDLEEGYVTFPTVPGGLLVKVGKLRSAFGKVNTWHTHISPWPDRPLVTRNLLGGEEGLSDAGVSVARLVPNPWIFLEVTGQVFRGDAGDIFQASRPSDLSYLGHVRAYQDITDSSNLDFGASLSVGHNNAGEFDGTDVGRFTTRLFGVDATYRWRPLRRAIYRSFIARTELVWSRRQQFDGVQPAFGFYASADYQLARRWFAGVRFDRSGRADDASLVDTGQALTLTYWPSEFSQLRGMYRRTRYAERTTANEFLFQLQFSIGAHGAHPF